MSHRRPSCDVRLGITCLLFLLLDVAPLCAQVRPEHIPAADRLFQDGLALYRKGAFADAARVFGDVLVLYPNSHRETAALLMKGKALLFAGELRAADETLRQFLQLFPFSNYAPDAHYALGLVHVRQQKPEQAVESFLTCLRAADPSSALRTLVLAALDSTIDMLISVPPLQRLIAESPLDDGKEFLMLKLGEKFLDAGNVTAATAVIDSLDRYFRQPAFAERNAALRRRLLEPSTLKIAVVLPLLKNGGHPGAKEREIGLSLYEGIQLAYEEFVSAGGAKHPLTLEVKDIEREVSRAVTIVRELCADPGVLGIIGPPFSNAAFAVAYHVNTSGVPLVTPTANADGIAATGPYVFQANPDFTARAKAMARHAVQSLGLMRLGVLAPNEPNSRTMANAFIAEATRLGATVLAAEFYEPGSTSLVTQLTALRRRANEAGAEPFLMFGTSVGRREAAQLARLGVSQRLLDSLIATKAVVNAERLLGAQARSLLDGEKIPYRVGDPRVDSLDRPVTALQGLYSPISSPEEIGIVSSQVAYFNIQTRLLGSGEWNNEGELAAHRLYCTGVIFESDTYIEPTDDAYRVFVEHYARRFGRRPDRNSIFGYDVGKVVFAALQKGALTRDRLRDALAALPVVQGLHAKISFNSRRVNPWLHIMQYTGSGIQRVAEISAE